MDLRQLRYFAGIVEAGSLSRAAARLHVAQSSISHHLAALEAELKLPLLVRGPTGVALTDAGRTLYRHAQAILAALETAKNEATKANRPPYGRVSVGIPSVLSPILSFRLFTAVRAAYPDIRLSLVDSVSAILREFVQNGRLDMAVLFVGGHEPGLRVQPLLQEELFYLTAAPVPAEISLAEIAARPLLVPGRDSAIQRVFQALLAREGLAIETAGEIDSVQTLKRAVAAGIGGTILPWAALYEDDAGGRIHAAPLKGKPLIRPVSLCFPEVIARSLAAEAVAAMVKDAVHGLVESGEWRGVTLAG